MRSRVIEAPGLLVVMGSLAGGLLAGAVSRTRGSVAFGMALGALGGALGDYMLDLLRKAGFNGEPAASVPEVTAYLSRHLGEVVTAYLSGAEDPSLVKAWSQGAAVPAPEERERLQVAYEAAQCLVDACGDEMTRSWFFGMNLSLRDTAPAYVLRHWDPKSWEAVLSAAQDFAEI